MGREVRSGLTLEFPGLHWTTHLLSSLSQGPPVREKPKTASKRKGENCQGSTAGVRSYIFHSDWEKGWDLERIWVTEWDMN